MDRANRRSAAPQQANANKSPMIVVHIPSSVNIRNRQPPEANPAHSWANGQRHLHIAASCALTNNEKRSTARRRTPATRVLSAIVNAMSVGVQPIARRANHRVNNAT